MTADFNTTAREKEILALHAEIARLQEAKRHALALADAKGKENVLLRRRLDTIANIADGSGTVNSLPHIAKIARGDRPMWPPGAEITAQAFDSFDLWRRWFDPEGECELGMLVECYSRFGHCRPTNGQSP